MVLQMLKCLNHLLTLHRTFKMTHVDLTRHRQGYPSRHNPPISCSRAVRRKMGRLPFRAQVVATGSRKEKPNSSLVPLLVNDPKSK